MVNQEYNIMAYLNFSSNLQAIKESQKAITGLAKTTKSSTGQVKQAFNQSINTLNLNSRIAASDALMKKLNLSSAQLSMGMKRAGFAFDAAGRTVNSFGKQVQLTDADMRAITKGSKQFKMHLLSIMFAAMALNRVMTKMWRSMITTYQKANEDTEGLGKATWHLQAAWEFFKYSLMDALLQSDLFKVIVKYLIEFVGWLNRLEPGEKALIAISLAVIAITSAVILLLAQLGLAKTGFEMLSWGGAAKTTDQLATAHTSLSNLAALAGIGLGIYVAWKGLQILKAGALENDLWKSFVGLLGTTLAGALIGTSFAKLAGFGLLAGGGVGAAIALTLGVLYWISWKLMGDDYDPLFRDVINPKLGTQIQGNLTMDMSNVNIGLNETQIELSEFRDNMLKTSGIAPELKDSLSKTTDSMWDLSKSVSVVNQGNSPTGLIHIIESEGIIIGLEPTFNSAIKSMTEVMDKMSVSISNQQSKFTSLIAEIDRYIRKLEEASRAESKSRSGGITGIIKSVLGSRATGGPINKTGPYLLHEGEYVINRHDMKTADGESKNITNNISLSVQTASSDPEEISRIIMDKINDTYSQLNDSTS
jgi:hypothetical protein